MAIPFYIVDAFTINTQPFTGNQAAICVLSSDDKLSDDHKQSVAAEMNLSETAFVSETWKEGETRAGNHNFTLRWFTPKNEVDLCGHATLATACALFDKLPKGSDEQTTVTFETKFKGSLSATITWDTGRIALDFPASPPEPISATKFPPLSEIIAKTLKGTSVSADDVLEVVYSPGTKKLLIRLEGTLSMSIVGSKLLAIKPDFDGMLKVQGNTLVKGVIVTVKGSEDIDFYSRYFAPWNGINEDPVTGSAHTVLAPYWSKFYSGKSTLIGRQASSRGGDVFCTLVGNRVQLEGNSKIVVRGELFK